MASEILIVAIGGVEASLLNHLCVVVAKTFGRSCRLGGGLPVPQEAFDARRGQYAAQAILQPLHPGKAERILGVVDLDLYVPGLNFVFGLADPRGRRALIALTRLRQRFYGRRDDEALLLARAAKEAIHELGHTYGLTHCSDRRCVMTFSNSLADTDYKGQKFCQRCQERLQRQKSA